MNKLIPGSNQLPAELPAELLELAKLNRGKGVSFKSEDQLTPLIHVLQSNSPQVSSRDDKYILNAKAGDFWFRGGINPIVDGETGFLAQFCGMRRVWTEWLPLRQGLVGTHERQPADIEIRLVQDDGREKQVMVRASNNNIVQDTRECWLWAGGAAYVLPCVSTQHTFVRQWMTYLRQLRHPQMGEVLPSFQYKFRLTTVPTSNAKGHWLGLKFALECPASLEEFKAALLLADDVEHGARRAELPLSDDTATAARMLRAPVA